MWQTKRKVEDRFGLHQAYASPTGLYTRQVQALYMFQELVEKMEILIKTY